MKLAEIAKRLGTHLEGDGNVEISGVAGIEEAEQGQITFIANPKYATAAHRTRASALVVTPDFPPLEAATLRDKNPYLIFARVIELFYRAPEYPAGVHPTACIHPSAKLGKNASVGAYVVIDADVTIGDNCTLLPHVVI